MNILLVDDNINVLESLQRGIDYRQLGIEKVYTASDSASAREILEKISIQILLTDIEMPGGSGIELLRWVNEKDMGVVTLFCTSYADFNYARKAVELHCFDYYLKPVAFDRLSEILKKAVDQVTEQNRTREYFKYGQYWLDNQKNRKDSFWRYLLFRVLEPDSEELQEILAREQTGYLPGERFDLWLFSFSHDAGTFFKMTATMREFVFQNICEEILGQERLLPESILWYEEDMAVGITRGGSTKEQLSRIAATLIRAGKTYLKCDVNIFCADNMELSRMRSGLNRLEAIQRENQERSVFLLEREYQKKELPPREPGIRKWEPLILAGNAEEFSGHLKLYLTTLEENKQISGDVMKAMELDFMQMVYHRLNEKQVEAHRVFCTDEYEYLRSRCIRSKEFFLRYVRYVLEITEQAVQAIEASETIADRLRLFMESHFSEDITRDRLAEVAYLNPDYMSRLFKKETGQSFNDYLLEIRMKKAAQLLAHSEESIYRIAQCVGYDNFSYFSRLFKNYSGLSPKEYRNSKIKNEPM